MGDVTKLKQGLLPRAYKGVILGDVIEHLNVFESQDFIRNLIALGYRLVVVVPYEYEQSCVEGNPYEVHLQPDLSPSVMADRYPDLAVVISDDGGGVYAA